MQDTTISRGMGIIKNASQEKAILEKVPDDKWAEGWTDDTTPEHEGMSCAIGHINRFVNTEGQLGETGIAFNNPCYFGAKPSWDDVSGFDLIVRDYLSSRGFNTNEGAIACINDGVDNPYRYIDDTPKARIIHLLDDMIEAGY